MADTNKTLPTGAGTTTGGSTHNAAGAGSRGPSGTTTSDSTSSGTGTQSSLQSGSTGSATGAHDFRQSGDLSATNRETSYQPASGRDQYGHAGREVVLSERHSNGPSTALVLGAALAGAVVGGALPYLLADRSSGYRSVRRSYGTDPYSNYDDDTSRGRSGTRSNR